MTNYVKTFTCPTCETPASGAGHLCHPNSGRVAFTCEFCNKTTSDARHVCASMVDKLEYQCKKCGRLAVYDTMLCEAAPIDQD